MKPWLYPFTLILLCVFYPFTNFAQVNITAGFTGPDTACMNTPVQFTNTSEGASNYYWSFCAAGFNTTPQAKNLGNPGNLLNSPVFMDYSLDDDGNYYGFISNYSNGNITRLDYGNSLLNTPVATNLGNFNGLIPIYAEGIQVKKAAGKCYAFVVAGGDANGFGSELIRLDFGSSFANTPTATSLGNVGNMLFPHDLFITSENNNFYGFTINIIDNTLTRFDFGNSLENQPVGINYGSIDVNYPSGFSFINTAGNWYAFITNRDGNSITRLDFGNSITNFPTSTNIGNPGNFLYRPRDISIFQSCNGITGLVVNEEDETTGSIIKLDFGSDILSNPLSNNLGNLGSLQFPHSISKFFLDGNDIYSFITNVKNNTITHLRYAGCTSTSIPSSTQQNPPPISYSQPGVYNVNLLVDIGLPTQASVCKQIVVKDCTPPVTAGFTAPDTVCINTPFNIVNTSENASSYYWSFCQADLYKTPEGENLGNINSGFSLPTYSDIVFQNGNYYVFVVNNYPGSISRLDFGNNLLNTPTLVDLGNPGNVISGHAEGIQVVNTGNNWYAIMVGGDDLDGVTSQIIKLDFGADITNTSPIATDWGNIGQLSYPHKLYIFNEASIWYGVTANYNNNTITRFEFGADFIDPPVGTNLGTFGILNGPAGLNAVKDNSDWYVFVTNSKTNSIARLDFGNSLLNIPLAYNLGNINGALHNCFDIHVQKYCENILGFVVNGNDNYNDIIRLDFNNDLTSIPSATSLGNIGNLSFPHSFSKLFRVGNDQYTIIPNAHNNTLTRIRFPGCMNSNIPGTSQPTPPQIMYDSVGVYNINLSVDEGLPTQTSYCKQIVVLNCDTACALNADFSFNQQNCDPKAISFHDNTLNADSTWWDFGNGQTAANVKDTVIQYANFGTYTVQLFAKTNSGCLDTATYIVNVQLVKDSAIITNDTTICAGSKVQLNAVKGLIYCWSPSITLSNPSVQNPVATPASSTTYYLNSQTLGKNLVVNGNFSNGNTGFSSEYGYQPPQNINEGKYWIGTNPNVWNGGMSACTDHTGGNGNMMMVNGAVQTNINVWKQTIPVLPNTNYAFSTWVQSVYPQNPAQLQFSINGILVGDLFNADNSTCIWNEFYSTWNSGNSTSATISIVNMNSIREGNDFALDDISFSEYVLKQDSIRVTVIDLPVFNAGNDTSICKGSSVQLNATGAFAYNWNATSGLSDTTISNPIASPSKTENFIATGYNTQGCYRTDTVKVSILSLPVVTVTNDTAICTGGSITLNATSPGTNKYGWTPSTSLSNLSINNPIASPAASTKYFVTVTDSNSCHTLDSVMVNVVLPPQITTINDSSICQNDSVALISNASNAISFIWTPAIGLNNPAMKDPLASPTLTTLYIVEASNGACGRKDSVLISVMNLPDIKAGNDTTICGNASAQLNATGGVSYTWSPAFGLSDATIANPVATPGSTAIYTVTGFGNNSCFSKDSIAVNVVPTPMFSITPQNASVCAGDAVVLTASGGDVYKWSSEETISDPSSAIITALPIATSAYEVIINNTICKVTDTLTAEVSVKPLPQISLSKSNDIDCINYQAQLIAQGGVSYTWYPSTYINNTHVNNPTVYPVSDTWYSVIASGENKCTSKDSVLVKSNYNPEDAKFNIASAFTPNHDGLNDCFSVRYWGPADFFELSIYNRWGQVIFHSNNINACWDGNYKGLPQPAGTYVYQISVSSNCTEGVVHKKGTFVLIR